MRNAGLDEAQAGIKIARRNINKWMVGGPIPGNTNFPKIARILLPLISL